MARYKFYIVYCIVLILTCAVLNYSVGREHRLGLKWGRHRGARWWPRL